MVEIFERNNVHSEGLDVIAERSNENSSYKEFTFGKQSIDEPLNDANLQ